MHLFGMRDDEASDRLAKALPNTSTTGLFLGVFLDGLVEPDRAAFNGRPKPGSLSLPALVEEGQTALIALVQEPKADGKPVSARELAKVWRTVSTF